MASASHSQRSYEYLDAFLAAIPHDSIPPDIASASRGADINSSPYPKFLDTVLRLVSGGPARGDDAPHLRDAWPDTQASVQRTLHALHPPSSSTTSSQPPTKRKRSPSSPAANQKKPKHGQGGDTDTAADDDVDDAPHLTLHALSATAPVRHKVDISLHARTLRLAHGTSGAPAARCALAELTRAFLLPTRARSSGALQWTALLLAGDKPAAPASRGAGGRASKAGRAAAAPARFELACSVPDSSSPRMTVHASASASTSTSASPSQTTSAREALRVLLTSALSGTPITLTTVERGAPLAGITAFRGVRETALWFFDGAGAGILADGRPAEFWALADLARGEAGVRVHTATGRTCSVVLTRLAVRADDGEDEMDENEEEEEGEEREFQMIDGKEREGILEWVRRHRGAFGIAALPGVAQAAQAADGEGEGKDGEGLGAVGDSDSDSDFETSSMSSDGGSPTSNSNAGSDAGSDAASGSGVGESHDDDEDGGEGDVEDEGEGDGDGSAHGSGDQESDEEDEEELDPKHHPLLRAGALPKMSRAAMDAAVGLVVGDLVGQARRGAPGHAAARDEHGRDDLDGGDDEEEDELDD